ncbi:HEL078Cp [Eremothecium sinecaudum]|uniref:HEL078Cp n=1 Tax=Eremothecium sinecaudum TaxID=45286 RepID=A0A0X8HTF8_9SACH|nr:HEL078Cp [Eremothecium sinecaudum]AMD21202.1 HEL078Cp [Eremothecium sinecaudum]
MDEGYGVDARVLSTPITDLGTHQEKSDKNGGKVWLRLEEFSNEVLGVLAFDEVNLKCQDGSGELLVIEFDKMDRIEDLKTKLLKKAHNINKAKDHKNNDISIGFYCKCGDNIISTGSGLSSGVDGPITPLSSRGHQGDGNFHPTSAAHIGVLPGTMNNEEVIYHSDSPGTGDSEALEGEPDITESMLSQSLQYITLNDDVNNGIHMQLEPYTLEREKETKYPGLKSDLGEEDNVHLETGDTTCEYIDQQPQRTVKHKVALNPQELVCNVAQNYFGECQNSSEALVVFLGSGIPPAKTASSDTNVSSDNERLIYHTPIPLDTTGSIYSNPDRIVLDSLRTSLHFQQPQTPVQTVPIPDYIDSLPSPSDIIQYSGSKKAFLLLPRATCNEYKNHYDNSYPKHISLSLPSPSNDYKQRTISNADRLDSQSKILESPAISPKAISLNDAPNSKPCYHTRDKVFPKIKVLIVEDNIINQAILSSFLRKNNITYEVASNGIDAVGRWKEGGIHLILMDLQLPLMTGLEATKQIRDLEKINGISNFRISNASRQRNHDGDLDNSKIRSPVIIVALTAYSAYADRKEALLAGCNDYLTKPVNLDWLSRKINEWGCIQALIDFDGWTKGESRMTDNVILRP